jgi:uncharacterized protein
VTANQQYYLPEGLPAPVPESDNLSKPYWDGLRENKLRVQRCGGCGTWQWGPEWICHKCQHFNPEWVEINGRGKIYSWTRVWHGAHVALKDRGPYVVVLVELPEAGGIRMIGNLLGDAHQPFAIGDEVEVVFEHHAQHAKPYSLAHWRKI